MKFKLMMILAGLAAFFVACGPPPAPEQSAEESSETTTSTVSSGDCRQAGEVVEEDSGYRLEVVTAGNCVQPEIGEFLQINLIGTLEDGTEFANSYTVGQPLLFPLGESFFPGWDKTIETMSIGETVSVVVPPEEGFGDQGTGVIPPGATLFFELELVGTLDVEIEVLEQGDGITPKPGDTVVVHYTGSLEDGTVFDSSLDRGEPFTFVLGVGQVIQGWDIGVGRMRVGEKSILTIPSDLGYGPAGAGANIPPNATLIFEVELLDVVPFEQ